MLHIKQAVREKLEVLSSFSYSLLFMKLADGL